MARPSRSALPQGEGACAVLNLGSLSRRERVRVRGRHNASGAVRTSGCTLTPALSRTRERESSLTPSDRFHHAKLVDLLLDVREVGTLSA